MEVISIVQRQHNLLGETDYLLHQKPVCKEHMPQVSTTEFIRAFHCTFNSIYKMTEEACLPSQVGMFITLELVFAT